MIGRFLSRQKANLMRPPDRGRRMSALPFLGIFFVILGLVGLGLSLFSTEDPYYQSGLHLSLGVAFTLLGFAERSPENRPRLTAGLRVASALAFLAIPFFYVSMAYYNPFGQTGALGVVVISLVLIPLMWAEILGYFKRGRDGPRTIPREGTPSERQLEENWERWNRRNQERWNRRE